MEIRFPNRLEADATITLRHVAKHGLIGKLLGSTVVRKQSGGIAAKLLAGLDHNVTTGQDVGRDFLLKAA
ncbi:MAG: hypothetical protein K8H74_02020 [Notoacmeibacter sp.]|nr:hypothetical protein [Notoacmeibacter sp.]